MKQYSLFHPPSITVADLTRYLRDLLDGDEFLRDVWVQGEISNFSRPPSGHLYFTLKDSTAALKCVVWRSNAARLRVEPYNGLAVEAHGAIKIFERDGQYQLYVDGMRPSGEGLLFQEFIRLKNRLEEEGLFDEDRKRPVPAYPNRIGIVTSPTGAALQDMLNTLTRRYPLAEVYLAPCAVQGDAAPPEIVAALQVLGQHIMPDVILLARGGGSLEDLWAFNDERVVRAIAASPVPIITGVGHETDFTLADFASDLRAPTPTGAAMMATPDRADLQITLAALQGRLVESASDQVNRRQQDLDFALHRLERASPALLVRGERQRLNNWQDRSRRAVTHHLELRRARWQGIKNRLQALNPDSILQRGFALIEKPDGSLIHSAAQASPGDKINVRLWDGSLRARVEDTAPTGDSHDIPPAT